MQPAPRHSRDLDAYARAADWHQNILAPGLHILQALTPGGDTASGAGHSRERAYARCLAEAAEIHALQAAGGTAALGFLSRRDGLAAHPDPATARAHARLEAVERHSIACWWHGGLPARPLDPHWLAATGIAGRIALDRLGAAQKRPSGLWLVDTGQGPSVVVCRSSSQRGQQPMLGFGCHGSAVQAALKALREVMLMELNLMTLQIARRTGTLADHQTLQDAVAAYARHTPRLLPDTDPVIPPADAADADAADPALPDRLAQGLTCRDITNPDSPMPVWLCRSALTVPMAAGSPYL